MATKIGTCVKITLATKELVGELSTSLSTAVNIIEVSSKDSCNATNVEAGRVAETVSVSSIATTDGTATDENWKDAQAAAVAGTKVAVVITEYDNSGTEVSGAINIAGTAVISNVSLDIPDNDKITFSCDLSFDGATTITTNS